MVLATVTFYKVKLKLQSCCIHFLSLRPHYICQHDFTDFHSLVIFNPKLLCNVEKFKHAKLGKNKTIAK